MQNSYYSPKAKFILLTITMYMAGKVIQANVVFSLAIRAGKMGPAYLAHLESPNFWCGKKVLLAM